VVKAFDAFTRVLHEQANDIACLQQEHPTALVISAGDFNQTLMGPNRSGSDAKPTARAKVLDALGFDAWNGDAAHARRGRCAIDLVCGPRDRHSLRQRRIDPVVSGVVMSDHAGYWVEI
jgi:endonuclease/exonuclease/phosphatase family metal-dependent hydrolase